MVSRAPQLMSGDGGTSAVTKAARSTTTNQRQRDLHRGED